MIWLIGGTKDAKEVAKLLPSDNIIITVATQYGYDSFKDLGCEIKKGAMDKEQMKGFVKKNIIDKIIDFSHPYAIEVSQNAIDISKVCNITYIRYERPQLKYKKGLYFDKVEDIIDYLESKEGNILNTLGSNTVGKFADTTIINSLYTRIIPSHVAIDKCLDAGMDNSKILAIQGPFSREFNIAMMKNYHIKYLITKESGDSGSEREKVEAAKELGVEVLILKRPQLDYPIKFEDIDKLIKHLDI